MNRGGLIAEGVFNRGGRSNPVHKKSEMAGGKMKSGIGRNAQTLKRRYELPSKVTNMAGPIRTTHHVHGGYILRQ